MHWTQERPIVILIFGRILALDGETAENYAQFRLESRIGRRNGRLSRR